MTDRPPTFNELLINAVQHHPELYDQQHRVCTDSEERNQLWENIAKQIDENVSAGFAKKRWLQLRDRYRKELKTSLRNMIKPKWPYFEKLVWLDSYLKDSKSAGLNTLFLSSSFENLDSNNSTALDSLIKEETHEISDFQYSHSLNANTLLENIMAISPLLNFHTNSSDDKHKRSMAASSSAFSQFQRENAKFSPDSFKDEEAQLPSIQLTNALLNSSASTSGGSEAGSSSSSDVESKQQNGSSSDRRSSSQSDTSCETDNQQNEQRSPNEHTSSIDQSIFGNGSENFNFMGSMLRAVTQQQQKAVKQRNPPYLVRRGGGIKVKDSNIDRQHVLSAFKPLSKTMSVGGLMTQLNNSSNRANLQLTQSVGLATDTKTGLEEWQQNQEWSNDEDMLFARLIVLRLRKFPSKDNRKIKSSIFELLNEKEEQIGIN